MELLFNLLVNVLSCADVFECKQGENSTEVVNILVNMVKIFILFQNYNFKNDLPLNFASVCALAPGMALVVEHWKEQCIQEMLTHTASLSYGKVLL